MYTYGEMLDEINEMAHCGCTVGTVGASGEGRLIPYVHTGSFGGKQIIVTAGIHAREHVGSLYCMRQAQNTAKLCKGADGGVYFVPMLNPDGNELAAHSTCDVRKIRLNGGSSDFSLWKANAAGVDLNVNFDANWGSGKSNVRVAGAANYIGSRPESECETRAIADFTRKIMPAATVSYHALGREVYWYFFQTGDRLRRDRRLAEWAADRLQCRLIGDDRGSAGGYKDWCVQRLGIPALTVELVSEKFSHPLPDDSVSDDIALGADFAFELLGKISRDYGA